MTLDEALRCADDLPEYRRLGLFIVDKRHIATGTHVIDALRLLAAETRKLVQIEALMDDFVGVHSDGEGPNNLQFDRLFESVLDVLRVEMTEEAEEEA